MPVDAAAWTDLACGFVAALSRVGIMVLFIPVPGLKSGPDLGRLVLAVCLALCLAPVWPAAPAGGWSPGAMAVAALADAAYGAGCGLAAAFLLESFLIAAQLIGLPAGFSFASTFDPSSHADSPVLQVLLQITAGLLFFAAGVHHEALRAVAYSFTSLPTGTWAASPAAAEEVLRLGGLMLSTGVRLALPVVALLMFADLAMALMSRIQAQLQLLSLSFPVKILAALLVLAAAAPVAPVLFERAARQTAAAIHGWTVPR
jgi:flagellar biosynthetic protein FliR